MRDLISRQAAMDAIEKCHKQCCREDATGDEWIHYETTLNEVESIPPTPKNDADCISRQAAIEALVAETIYTEEELKEYYEANSHRNEWVNGIHEAVEVIKQLPPANNSETPNSSDCISRQAAIETVMECYDNDELFEVYEEKLRELPPAHPEIIRCKDCKYAEYIDDVKTLWCTECGQGRTVAPNDFCSYAERREVTE